jgi:hypothetical protein
MPSKKSPTTIAPITGAQAAGLAPPSAAIVKLGTVGGQEFTMQAVSPRAKAAAEAVEMYKGYVNTITTEDEKLFINNVLRDVKGQLNAAKAELAGITTPLVNIRRDALTAKQNAENAYVAIITHLETAERMLKNEILRFEQVQERKRLEEEAAVKRRAEEERQRLEAAAQKEADEANRKHQEEQERIAALERAGKETEAAQARLRADQDLEASAEKIEHLSEDAASVVERAIVPSSSVKMAGTSITGKWIAEVVDVKELFAGIADNSTPFADAVRKRVGGKLYPVFVDTGANSIEGIEINLPWFQDRARKEEANFNYRGMRARQMRDVRVTV